MPLSSRSVGYSTQPIVHDVDARWTMAYAAALGDTSACYLDTGSPCGVVAHPLFPVCVEWPAVLAARTLPGDQSLTAAERMRAVHATHDVLIHRLVRPGDRLTTVLTIAGVEHRTPGAYLLARLDTTDAGGSPVATTWMGSLYRGVHVDGPDRSAVDAPPAPIPLEISAPRLERRVPIASTCAHVYTECARIWNPIHTDVAFARAAGLPGIILHGTATLGIAVSALMQIEAPGHPERVRRIAARFGAMVPIPTDIVVRIMDRTPAASEDIVRFEVRTAAGGLAVRDGFVALC